MKQYDVIVIGGGPGGTEAAAIAASRGQKVALVEQDSLGGTCLNRGCVPTKCLCAAAERLAGVSDAADFGITIDGVEADYSRAHARATEVVASLREDVAASLAGVDVIHGTARLEGGRTVVSAGDIMKGHHIVIATGSRPAPFPAEGGEYALDSDTFLTLDTIPASVAIVGGGVIGLEFASILAAYGCSVSVLEYCKEVLPAFDQDIAKRLRSYLSRRGIKFILGAKVIKVDKTVDGFTVGYDAKGKQSSLEVGAVLGAVGRRPILPEGLSDAGVALDSRGYIAVDEHYATSAPGISAIGDVNGKCMLAHAACAQARVAMGVTDRYGAIPSVVFTMPECASVGVREYDGEGFKAVKVPYSANAKAVASGMTEGMLKLVCDKDGKIAGCHAVGTHAADLIAEASVLIDAGISACDFAHRAVSTHPGLSELLQTAASRLASHPY